MAQHDYVIANGTGAAVRSDLNNGLAAIVSQNSGASAPATTYAYMSWADTGAGVMKMRNGANSAWISLYELDGTFLAGDISLSAGAAATPSLFFTGDSNTGIYSPGADQVGISTGGTVRLSLSTTAVSSTLAVDHPLGAVGTPSITFTGDLNTGIYSPGADTLAFVEGGVEAMRINNQRELLIGTTTRTANGGVLQVSNGITFPATAVACTDANTLDDYEEGTFTPTVIGSTTAGTATYGAQSARYTKIGRAVQFELFLNWSGGTGTGDLQISGLPFTPASSNTFPACVIGYVNNLTLTALNIAIANILDSPAVILIRQTPTGGGAASNVAYDAAAQLLISGTYSV
jgi:hypothetical protein